MSAFARSLRDPFPPARCSTLMALIATVDTYDREEMATKMVPSMVGLMVDPGKIITITTQLRRYTITVVKDVRRQAKKAVETFLKLIQDHAEQMVEFHGKKKCL